MHSKYIVSLSDPVLVLGLVSQMSRLSQVTRQVLIYLNSSSRGKITYITFDKRPRLHAPHMSERQSLSSSKTPIQGVKGRGYPQEREDG